MRSLKSLARRQSGDTIVEVLIAMAVISLVLATSYAITNRNINVNQDTQERNQAQQIVQRQIEELRALYEADQTLPGFNNNSNTCIITDPPDDSNPHFVDNSDTCNLFSNSKAGPCTDELCYQVKIIEHDQGIYNVTVQWDNLHAATSTVSMEYGV
jgi:prepilin-type N-terminal cleavage/methylation domain-containing protein